MSEYVIGERIEPGKQPYALSKLETQYGVGLRIYGTESGTGGAYSDGSFVDVNAIGDSGATYYAFRVGDEPLYEGYVDAYELRHRTDTDTETIIDILSSLVTGDSIVIYNSGAPKPFSFIYRGGPQMFKIDEHIATITIEDEAVVQFSRQHPVYGIYGEDIKASFDENFEDTDQGVYDTSATGTTIMENHQQKDTIYLKGTGTVTVWAGLSAVNFPFKAQGKGGGSGGGTKYIGTTTTALSNGSTKNPIVVDGQSYTAQFGDIAVYNYTEFIFDGTKWGEFGRSFDTTPTNGSANAVTSNGVYELIHKGSGTDSTVVGKNSTASGYYSTAMGYGTYATGTSSVAMGSGTVAGGAGSVAMGAGTTTSTDYSVAMGHMTTANQICMTAMGRYNSPNEGDLFNIGNGTNSSDRSNIVEVNSTSMNVNGDIKRNGVSLGDLSYKDSATGTANVSVTGTTDGSVTISPTKETIYSTTNKGTLPSFTYNSTTEELTFNAGTLPSTTAKSVVTNATATFTGASTTSTGTVNVTVS